MGIEVSSDAQLLVLLNMYLPVDNSQNIDDFLFYMTKLREFIDNHTSPYVAVFGDFNANILPNSNSAFGRHLLQFCSKNNFLVADQCFCPPSCFTFYSDAHQSVSWLYHFVTNINMLPLIKHIPV